MSRPARTARGSVLWRFVIVAAILLPAVLVKLSGKFGSANAPIVVTDKSLPDSVVDAGGNRWLGRDAPPSDEELNMLQSPAAAQKIYEGPGGDRVQVLMLQVNNTQNAHDPTFCMTGQNYEMTRCDDVAANWVGLSGKPYRVSRAVFTKEGFDVTMFYWIQTPTGTIADMSAGFKLGGVLRALRGQSTKGVAIRVICLPHDGGAPTSPAVGQVLWKSMNQTIDVERLVKGM